MSRNNATSNITLFLCLLFNQLITAEGFVSGTMVRTPSGYVPIDQLKENDEIISYDFENAAFAIDTIIKIRKHRTNKIIQINFDGQILEVAPDHKFYCPRSKQRWVQAKYLKKQHLILKNILELVRIDNLTEIEKEIDTYCLSVENNHNFFVSKQNIFVHNFAIPFLSAIIAWFAANFEISIGVGIGGLILAKGLSNGDARKKAKEWGYKEDKNPPFNSHGKPAFKKGQRWISPDRDGHNGGVWKEFEGKRRVGTLDEKGNKVKG